MRFLSGADVLMEARYSEDVKVVGLTMPRPPSLTGIYIGQGAHELSVCHLEELYP